MNKVFCQHLLKNVSRESQLFRTLDKKIAGYQAGQCHQSEAGQDLRSKGRDAENYETNCYYHENPEKIASHGALPGKGGT
jgi:hypothetical protein